MARQKIVARQRRVGVGLLRLIQTTVLLLAASVLAPCQGAKDVPKLKAIFGANAQQADYVVLIDTSGSMRRFWPVVIDGISEFVAALPDKDHVSIIPFDREATNARLLPRTLDPQSRQDLMTELRHLPPPSGTPDQQYTDFGRALSALGEELGRPGANRLQFVFMFSDFEHDPAADSEYRSHDPQNPAWQALAARYNRVTSNKMVENFALMLPTGANVGRDLQLVRQVLGTVEVIPINDPQTLHEWFDRQREEIVRDKLRVLVRRDLLRGWSFDVQTSAFENQLNVRSNLQKLDLTLSVKEVAVSTFRAQVPPVPISLRPGQAVRVAVLRPAGFGGWLRWLFTPRRTQLAKITLEGQAEAQSADEIEPELAMNPRQPLARSGQVQLPLAYGAPAWIQLLALLVLVVFAIACWRAWWAPAMPVSRVFRRVTVHGSSHGEELKIPADRRESITVGNSRNADLVSGLQEPAFAFRLVSRKPALFRLRPKRGIYVHGISGAVYYRTRRFDGKSRRWSDQDALLPPTEAQAVSITFQTKLSVKRAGDEVVIRMGN